ncbi:GGDEF domain-containing protein [Salinisphaera sp. LB1]|uniref:sensor domain-containing phosphodiesterase n=1 Tax=Salinisphaera sp. LB1 TaxID=2183911 RepID=UPI000D7050D9|nr:GGDEF domain-containing protein [Salinisphaera sp. LB1]AWN16444.1 diguanylate cyclase/phosphodiesterase (GGDEF & EAL domains) with PAS/PAC sensor(s) [Salinisphaera sp. LB1]
MDSSTLETQRLAALDRLQLMDTPPEERFERLTRIARRYYHTGIALFTLMGADRQWFKSHPGVTESEVGRSASFCDQALRDTQSIVVPDARRDPALADHPWVTGAPGIRFYAGVAIHEPGGFKVGTLCVIDTAPRRRDEVELDVLYSLGAIIEDELARRRPTPAASGRYMQQSDLTAAIRRAQHAFLAGVDERSAYAVVLDDLITLTGSRFGFIGEMRHDTAGNPYLKVQAIHNRDWTPDSQALYQRVREQGIRFERLNNLVGAPMTRGKVVISQDLDAEPLSIGLPTEHPPMSTYIGMPVFSGKRQIGVVGLANRDIDYELGLAQELEPLLQTLGNLIERDQLYREKREQEKNLARATHYDALTGLPNRYRLSELFGCALVAAARRNTRLTVGLLDLDDFKTINDTHGRAAGDVVLCAVAERLRRGVRQPNWVGRLGGDEFVVILQDVEDERAYAHLLATIHEPIRYRRTTLQISASMGVTVYPDDDASVDLLLRHADQAMCAAKELGKNRYEKFDLARYFSRQERGRVLDRIAEALRESQFELHYQPKIDLVGRRVAGFEALLRWNHPTDGLIAPGSFLNHLEYTDFAGAVGRFVIERAITQLQRLDDEALDFTISVNLSPSHFLSPGFCNDLWHALQDCPVRLRGRLILELLETTALDDSNRVIETLLACRELGVQVSLDDFGTGYSSLDYFRRLPAHEIKIDRSFVQDMRDNGDDEMIVDAIISLAQSFKRRTVAEGIENIATHNRLIEMGCEYGQGFLYSRPLPAGAALEWARGFRWADIV